jgi:hypothetical protein
LKPEFKTIDDAIAYIKKTYWGGNDHSFGNHNSDGEFSCIGGLAKQYKSGSSYIHFLVRDAITLAVTIKSAKINPNIVSTDET